MDRSPCCDTRLRLASPPLGYECVECLQPFDLDAKPGADADPDGSEGEGADTCEETKNDGEVCGRDRPCQYHDD